MIKGVRTTLDIEDNLLQVAKELAGVRGLTIGQMISALVRKGLEAPAAATASRNGVPLLPRRGPGAPRPTMKLVNELRDEA
jgi:hypothetical protein